MRPQLIHEDPEVGRQFCHNLNSVPVAPDPRPASGLHPLEEKMANCENKLPPLPTHTNVREAIVLFDMLATALARLSLFGKDTVLMVRREFEREILSEPGIKEILALLDAIAADYDVLP